MPHPTLAPLFAALSGAPPTPFARALLGVLPALDAHTMDPAQRTEALRLIVELARVALPALRAMLADTLDHLAPVPPEQGLEEPTSPYPPEAAAAGDPAHHPHRSRDERLAWLLDERVTLRRLIAETSEDSMSRLAFEMRLDQVEAELLALGGDDDDDALVYEPPALSGPHALTPQSHLTPMSLDEELALADDFNGVRADLLASTMTQTELARRLGVSPTTISLWVNGRVPHRRERGLAVRAALRDFAAERAGEVSHD